MKDSKSVSGIDSKTHATRRAESAQSSLGVCPNCESQKPDSDPFCRNCGQKHTRLSDGLGYFVGDFLTSFLSVDGRAFRTVSTLFFRPGHAASDFLLGRRSRYLSSAQTYLVSVFFFFLLLGRWVEVPEIGEPLEWQIDGQRVTFSESATPASTAARVSKQPPASDANPSEANRSAEEDNGPIASERQVEMTLADGTRLDDPPLPQRPNSAELRPLRSAATIDFYHEVREITIHGQSVWISLAQFREFATRSDRAINQFFVEQDVQLSPWVIRLVKNVALLTTDFGIAHYVSNSIALASQIALLLLPLLAILIRIFHWRSCHTWLAAFIVSAHFHSTIYLSLGILMCFNLNVAWLAPVGCSAFVVYWLATLRQVFQQSWLVIGSKSILIIPLYFAGVLIAVLLATVGTIFVI